MPLAFDSLSHGSIAFGFFNIESEIMPSRLRFRLRLITPAQKFKLAITGSAALNFKN
ncbi:hypothetical protein D1BOALGB6SA_9313 [Olavius sp. associated proteobacterium Delta 1]|nr:hypothetical protein D1BOALGB6SA_9313 [Olavius sp. associated proteobacterium Delta 1]